MQRVLGDQKADGPTSPSSTTGKPGAASRTTSNGKAAPRSGSTAVSGGTAVGSNGSGGGGGGAAAGRAGSGAAPPVGASSPDVGFKATSPKMTGRQQEISAVSPLDGAGGSAPSAAARTPVVPASSRLAKYFS